MINLNSGKVFETNFKKSVPDDILFYRFRDGTSNWDKGSLTRFQQKNVCDCMLYNGNCLYFVELKNHKGKSIPLNCIRESQREELTKYSKYKNTICGIVINFQDVEECYWLFIDQINDFISNANRNSIPIAYCRENGIKLANKRLRTNYSYDIENLLKDVESNLN